MRFLWLICLIWIGSVEAREATELRSFGEEAPSTIYVFTSPNCSHCRDYHKRIFPDILKRFVDTGRAQLFVVDMPVTRTAMDISKIMRCLPDEQASKLEGWVYENQSRWMTVQNPNSVFLQYAQAVGMGLDAFNQCLADADLENAIIEQRNRLSALYGVRGTPTTILRHGNVVKYYVGAERQAVLYGLDQDLQAFEAQQIGEEAIN